MNENLKGEILIYQTENGNTKIDVFMDEKTVWLSQKQISQLFQKGINTINEHIKNIYADGELQKSSTIRKFRIVQNEGVREVAREIEYYNLNMILAIGYRVRSNIGMQFRNWASNILIEYMQKGFAMDDMRLKNPQKFGKDYFDELLARIRDIRASEKRFYMKVRDIYSLSVDYNSQLKTTKDFFANAQNMLLFAVTGKTAAEIIFERVDAEKRDMGLTNYKGDKLRKSDIDIAKNYLDKDEISELNRLVTMFLDHAEDMAKQNAVIYMSDWDNTIREFLQFSRRNILNGYGKISNEKMEKKVLEQYSKYYRKVIEIENEIAIEDEINYISKIEK